MGSTLLITLIEFILFLLGIYKWIVIAAVLITWVNPDPYNPIVRFLRQVTEPLFCRVRRNLPFVAQGGFDFSPIVVIFAIILVQRFLANLIYAGLF